MCCLQGVRLTLQVSRMLGMEERDRSCGGL